MNFLNKYDPFKNERVEIMDKDGKIIHPELMPDMSDEEIIEVYKIMTLSRMQDDIQNKMQRQGRMLSFLSSTGQEAAEVGYAKCLRKGVDWFVSGYRNNAAWLTTGVPIRNIIMYWMGNEAGGRSPEGVNTLPPNIVIGSQYSQATGIAFSNKYKKIDSVVMTTTGDGGTSEGETYESMNFAMLHKSPVIFICENNKWAISTPVVEQTCAKNFAMKSVSSGVPSIRVDGNDFFAVYAVMKELTDYVKENGPVFVELDTYRLGAHSSSDSPDIYRPKDQFEEAKLYDPLIRMKKYLIEKGLWSDEKQTSLDEEQKAFVLAEFEYAEKNCNYPLEDIFKYQYDELDEDLKAQQKEAQAFFKAHPLVKGE